jgi:hypothetical protein
VGRGCQISWRSHRGDAESPTVPGSGFTLMPFDLYCLVFGLTMTIETTV